MRRLVTYAIAMAAAISATFALSQVQALQITPGQQAPATQQPNANSQPANANNQQPPMPPGPNPNSQYRLGPDSLPQPDVPKGEIRGPYTLPSKAYPGTQHTYWVYVPAQYDKSVPAA